MHRDMLLLTERLVVAMETMSQDVKNMCGYIHDLSCCVSYLVNEKRENEYISVGKYDVGENPPSHTSAGEQEASVEREYSGPYEPMVERTALPIAEQEQSESLFGDLTSTNIDPHESSAVLIPESNPIFTEGVKIEEQSEDEVCNEFCNMHGIYGNSPSNQENVTYTIATPEEQCRAQEMESVEDASAVHIREDSEERPHKCSVCEKSFKNRCNLQRHTRVHSGEKPYKCNICGNAFSQSFSRTLHMRCHTGERPYKCTLCGKAFAHKGTLGSHMRIHTGDKPFKCPLCGKPFSRNENLKIHMRTHTGEKP